jgi:hypothetical protein
MMATKDHRWGGHDGDAITIHNEATIWLGGETTDRPSIVKNMTKRSLPVTGHQRMQERWQAEIPSRETDPRLS